MSLRQYSEGLVAPQNESEASEAPEPQALFLRFTPSHESSLGMRATGTIPKVPPMGGGRRNVNGAFRLPQ